MASDPLYYLSVKHRSGPLGFVIIDPQTSLKCDAWETSFIVYEGTSGTILESAEHPGVFALSDKTRSKIFLKEAPTDAEGGQDDF